MKHRPALITAVLFLATFTAGTAEYILSGQLDLVAHGLGVSEATAGQLVTVFSLAYGLMTPVLVVVTARVERRLLISTALLVFAAANLVCWFDPTLLTIMTLRIVMAASTGVVVVTALSLAVRLVAQERRARAVSTVMMGVTASLVLGVPAGRAVAQLWNWTAAFPLSAALAGFVAGIAWMFLPRTATQAAVPLRRQIALLTDKRILLGLAVTLLWLGGYAALNTYIAPYLVSVVGLAGNAVSLVLLLFGLASIVGLQIGGYLTDHVGAHRTLTASKGFHVLVLAALPLISASTGAAVAAVLLWGAAAWASTSAQQIRVAALAPDAPDVLMSLNQSVMQIAIALGAGASSFAAAHSPARLPWLAAAGVAASLVLMHATHRLAPAVPDTTSQITECAPAGY